MKTALLIIILFLVFTIGDVLHEQNITIIKNQATILEKMEEFHPHHKAVRMHMVTK